MNAVTRDIRSRADLGPHCDYVTVAVGGQLFGLDITSVHDVFIAETLTPIPLAPPEVAGLLNLRGRVVTAICLRQILRLPRPAPGSRMVVGIEHEGESFGLVVDGVGEVLTLPRADLQPPPLNLDRQWTRFSRGIHWLEDGLLVVIDIKSILTPTAFGGAASSPFSSRGPRS